MNNNNNIILKDSLESFHQREFSLHNSQQRVALTSHCQLRLTNMKVGSNEREWKRNGSIRALEMDFPCIGFFAFLYFFVPLLLGFFVCKEKMFPFLFIWFTRWMANQSSLVCLARHSRWAYLYSWIKWLHAKRKMRTCSWQLSSNVASSAKWPVGAERFWLPERGGRA